MALNKLIQTDQVSIIYGDFKGKPNQELFRCPRALDKSDLTRYVDEYREILGFENDDTGDLRNVPGMKLLDYYRLYFQNGRWFGRWMLQGNVSPLDCVGVDRVVAYISEKFKGGCDYYMQDFFEKNYVAWGDSQRYLLKPLYSSIYKVMVDTTYGNGDYPVRIYVYQNGGRP